MLQHIPDLEKKIFYLLAGILFLAMPVLSLKSGISGDEQTFHYPHGKNVFNYYATLVITSYSIHYTKLYEVALLGVWYP